MKLGDRRVLLRWCLRALVALVPVGAVLGAALTEAACLPKGRSCSPGDYLECSCSDGRAGAQVCADDGASYGACDCSLLVDSGADVAVDASEAGGGGGACSLPSGRAIFCPCTMDAQCADGICHSYNMKGQLCTKACKTANDCPVPQAKGCGGAMVCAPGS